MNPVCAKGTRLWQRITELVHEYPGEWVTRMICTCIPWSFKHGELIARGGTKSPEVMRCTNCTCTTWSVKRCDRFPPGHSRTWHARSARAACTTCVIGNACCRTFFKMTDINSSFKVTKLNLMFISSWCDIIKMPDTVSSYLNLDFQTPQFVSKIQEFT